MEHTIIMESFSAEGQTVNIIRPEGIVNLELDALLAHLSANREEIGQQLLKTGAILFRNFNVNNRDGLLKVKEIFAGNVAFDYVDGNSPRTKLSNDVYTSTEYPKELSISLHNELSYSSKWPGTIFFYCHTPAEEGGETPIVDCRKILEVLDPGIVERFEKYGVRYTRYLSGAAGVGKTWMDTFETSDKSVVEKYCDESNISYTWDGNNLCLSQQGLGVAQHPVTGEKVWFNQANQFHPSGLPDEIYRGLKLIHSRNKHKFPQYAYYGNGEEIAEADLKQITDLHFKCAIKFPWQKNDVLMLDNMLMAHGRMPFKGERKVYVSMC
ncbi:TauD/TfdA family dioxygenase [Chitinophaga sp. Cy-1792]|uniref:TauD/TfdA family dioxygenase n=1 Tax=Chitinophaga sp. Cy-1792 TaxID=2608339 RepID=UPI00141FCBDF|nr:TauD/TfdA family dioxygenase [Chitinophaga sp. Cy-1792]NIG57752.1 TauD/TfdA family dioxygenase [Chitinophaga sp. Cy-1792]